MIFIVFVCLSARLLWRPEVIRSTGSGIIDGGQLPCGYWELNLVSLQEQQGLFNSSVLSPAPGDIDFTVETPLGTFSKLWHVVTTLKE